MRAPGCSSPCGCSRCRLCRKVRLSRRQTPGRNSFSARPRRASRSTASSGGTSPAGSTGPALGFQITFFRARPEESSDNPSQFNPRQILFAHAALSDPKRGRLLHDQRAARAGFSLAHAELDRTGVWIDDWRLELEGHRYQARIAGREFDFDFTLFANQLVLQGDAGFSRKGHRPRRRATTTAARSSTSSAS